MAIYVKQLALIHLMMKEWRMEPSRQADME